MNSETTASPDRGNRRVVPAGSQYAYDNFHFAAAVIDGANLRMSGVIGTGSDGKPAAEPATQFQQAFEAAAVVLTEAGLDFADVTDITSYHIGLQAHMAEFIAVKDRFVSAPYPAWTAVGTTELAIPGALVEIQIIARISDS